MAKNFERQNSKFLCVICKKPTKMACSQCFDEFYCSEEHQLIDRDRHLPICKGATFSMALMDLDVLGKLKNLLIHRYQFHPSVKGSI